MSSPRKTFAAVAAVPPSGEWTVVQNKRAAKAPKKKPSLPRPTMDQRSFELVYRRGIRLSHNKVANVMSAINRALHRERYQG